MAEGTAGMTSMKAQPARDPGPLEAEIVRQRRELTALVAELNQRRRELTDIRLQMRRHAAGLLVTVFAAGAAAAGTVAYGIWRARRRETVLARSGRLRHALGRMIDRPERVAVHPSAVERLIGSAASAATAFLIKAALERLGGSYVRAAPRRDGSTVR
jgi:hypothetical protein